MGCAACGSVEATCSCGGSCAPFTEVTEEQIDTSLVGSLTDVVDCIRNIATDLGARQYRVSLVWTRWSGGERGVGQESVVTVYDVLPTPLVSTLNQVNVELTAVGLNEVGGLRVSEISPRLNEDLLNGRDVVVRRGDLIPDDVSFYWEVYFPGGARRRFLPKSAPNKNPTGFEWTVDLLRANGDRERDGLPS